MRASAQTPRVAQGCYRAAVTKGWKWKRFTAASLFPGQTVLLAPAFYLPALAKPREGWLSAAPAALLPLPRSAGNRILLIYQGTVRRGIRGSLSFPELCGVDETSSSFVQGRSCK